MQQVKRSWRGFVVLGLLATIIVATVVLTVSWQLSAGDPCEDVDMGAYRGHPEWRLVMQGCVRGNFGSAVTVHVLVDRLEGLAKHVINLNGQTPSSTTLAAGESIRLGHTGLFEAVWTRSGARLLNTNLSLPSDTIIRVITVNYQPWGVWSQEQALVFKQTQTGAASVSIIQTP